MGFSGALWYVFAMMRLIASCLLFVLFSTPAYAEIRWEKLEPGLEYAEFKLADTAVPDQGFVRILRVAPEQWTFRLLSKKEHGTSRSAGRWADEFGLVAAINAGMYQEDYVSNVGYMRGPETKNNRYVNAYKSVFAFAARDGQSLPRIFDLDVTPFDWVSERYAGIVQNLRLIKRPGVNRWSPQSKRWSEAALAQDEKGRILFIFMGWPMTMHDFNERLLALPLGIVAAQHMEGGQEASLSVRHPNLTLDMFGGFDANLDQNDIIRSAWPIPNVLGLSRKQ